jgi:hypothetical protein
MSFAAVIGPFHRVPMSSRGATRAQLAGGSILRRALAVAGRAATVLSTMVATLATAPFSAYHFQT